jgi:acetylornithine deacetylase
LRGILPLLPEFELAIVGEPTLLDLAIAEKGLLVYDAIVKGTPSHAAHPNDDNPIYKLGDVLKWFEELEFEKKSEMLGSVKTTCDPSSLRENNIM